MKRPSILFLDFDGVLHVPGRLPFEYLPDLEAALAPHPELKIVVSSSWQEVHGREEIAKFLGPLASCLTGLTSDAPQDDELLQARQAADAAQALPVVKRLHSWPIYRFLRTPGLRQREIECWLRHFSEPGQTWLALDDDVWNFDEGYRHAVLVNLTKSSATTEFERLRSAIATPDSISPATDPAYAWWELVVSVPVSPVGSHDRLEKVRFDDIPAELREELDQMMLARNYPGDGVWLTDWCEFLVRRLVNLRRKPLHPDASGAAADTP